MIYKSISSVRSIVREWQPDDERSLFKIRALPTQFQAYIPGANLRVHVVGDSVFATAIDSPAVDYRYAQRDGFETVMRPVELPAGDLPEMPGVIRTTTASVLRHRFETHGRRRVLLLRSESVASVQHYQENTGQPIAEASGRLLGGKIMDVQVIENWSEIEGKVAAVTPHPELAGYVTATIDVERVSPVEGYANLFSRRRAAG